MPEFDTIPDATPLSRFFYRGQTRLRGDGSVKHQAFLPERNPVNDRLETSIVRVDDLPDNSAIRAQGKALRTLELKGWAVILAEHARAQQLDVIPDPPPDRHAVLIQWPSEKEKRIQIAQQLAKLAGPVVSLE